MKTNKKITRIVTGIFFLSFISLVGFAQGPRGDRQKMTAEQQATKQTEMMVKQLSLTEDQAEQVGAINIKYATKMEEMRSSGDRPDRDAMKAIREAQKGEYSEVLSEDQMAKLEEMKESRGKNKQGKRRER